jgi:hypothetical protein
MVEAPVSILPQPSRVIAVLARQRAFKEVEAALRRQGRKLSQMPKREILALAEDYLLQHRRAFLEQTWEWVRSSPSLLALYEKEQRERAKCGNDAQRAKG